MATFIVNHSGEWIDHDGVKMNPIGYQNVLFFTIALYILALLICLFLVRPTDKALEAKKAKQAAK